MSADPVSVHVQRGLHLLRVRRYTEAEAAFKEALSGDPDNDVVLHQLAITLWHLDREKEALGVIQQAIRVAPNESEYHAFKAILVGTTHNVDFAMGAANEAIRLDPSSAFAWYVRAQLHLDAKKLPKAEADARAALERDPDHSGAANVLSHALRLQGRIAENTGQIAGMLARDPENDSTHAAAGWNALHAGKYPEAQNHFREALRLNPESEFARTGLIESFKARSRLYRVYLRWTLWMAGKSSAFQWAMIIGLYIIARFSSILFRGEYAPIAGLIIILYFLFVLWGHVARGVGNFMLVCDRFARHALRRMEKVEGWFVGLTVICAVLAGAAGAVTRNVLLLLFAGCLLTSAIPLSHTFTNSSKIGRVVFGAIGVFALVSGVLVLFSPLLPASTAASVDEMAFSSIVVAMLSTWLANFNALRR